MERWRGHQTFAVNPSMDDAELDSRASTGTIYWEGPVRLRNSGTRSVGRGYLELTDTEGRGKGTVP